MSVDPAALLLADRSPCLRLRVLRDLLGRGDDDPEVQELAPLRDGDALVAELARAQQPDGSWKSADPASTGSAIQVTARALARLGYLGFEADHPVVGRGAAWLFALQAVDGSWPLERGHEETGAGYTLAPLQTALPLRGLAACGYAEHPAAERAYDWLLARRLDDGAWPTGIAAGVFGRVAGYRRLAHSRWGCRSNTTAVLICLALHPRRRNSPEARRALDLLLGRETRDQYAFGCEVARLIGAEPSRGFFTYFARFDPALVLDLCWRTGAGRDDARVDELAQFVAGLQGPHGLWAYPARPQVARWLSFDVRRSLARLSVAGDWVSQEPRTPFQAYPRRRKRY